MSEFLPSAVLDELHSAQTSKRKKASRLRVRCDGLEVPVLRMWSSGFSVEVERAEGLAGLVDIYDGARHLSVCLIVASEDAGGERRFEFKRATEARDHAPLDFERVGIVPAGYLPDPSKPH